MAAFPAIFARKLDCLERITQRPAPGCGAKADRMQRFFRRVLKQMRFDNLCLAKVMTLSFFSVYGLFDLDREAEKDALRHVISKCSGMASRSKE